MIVKTYVKIREPIKERKTPKGVSIPLDSYIKLDEVYENLSDRQKFSLLEKITEEFNLELEVKE